MRADAELFGVDRLAADATLKRRRRQGTGRSFVDFQRRRRIVLSQSSRRQRPRFFRHRAVVVASRPVLAKRRVRLISNALGPLLTRFLINVLLTDRFRGRRCLSGGDDARLGERLFLPLIMPHPRVWLDLDALGPLLPWPFMDVLLVDRLRRRSLSGGDDVAYLNERPFLPFVALHHWLVTNILRLERFPICSDDVLAVFFDALSSLIIFAVHLDCLLLYSRLLGRQLYLVVSVDSIVSMQNSLFRRL